MGMARNPHLEFNVKWKVKKIIETATLRNFVGSYELLFVPDLLKPVIGQSAKLKFFLPTCANIPQM